MSILKTYKTKVAEVNDQGLVNIIVNAFNNVDADGDISMPGSYTKTLAENFSRVKWFLNHNTNILLGVPLKGEQTSDGLQITAQFNMNKQISRDTYTDYKLYQENGRTLEHSVGVDAIKRDPSDNRKVTEWRLWEFSTLTSWGANPDTPLLNIKSKDAMNELEFINKALKAAGYSDERLKYLEKQVSLLTKSLQGEMIVTCPICGNVFDYNSVQENTLNQMVLDYAQQYAEWIVSDTVYEEMQNLAPEIQAEVLSIIQAQKSMKMKSIDSFTNYVHCPKCYSHVTKSNTVIEQPDEFTAINDDEPDDDPDDIEFKGRYATFNLKTVNGLFIK